MSLLTRHGADNFEPSRRLWSGWLMNFAEPKAAVPSTPDGREQLIYELRRELEALRRSRSWRLTAPLRAAAARLRRLMGRA